MRNKKIIIRKIRKDRLVFSFIFDLRINKKQKTMILGIDLGGTNIRIGQIKNGTIIQKITAPSPSEQSLEDSLSYLESMISGMITPDVKGIGIGVPSVLNAEKGIIYNVANIPSWREVHLKDVLENIFNVPVCINNDSNCFTLGEKKYGTGKTFRNIVGITLGTGVGAGIIIDNKLYGGNNTGAGEIGCLPYLEHNFEHYCSSTFFTSYHQTTGKEAAEKARKGDLTSLEIWSEFGGHIGHLIQAVLYTYDPEAIVFGGGIADAFPLFFEGMKKTINGFPYPETLKRVQIMMSQNKDISLLGAAALVADQDMPLHQLTHSGTSCTI